MNSFLFSSDFMIYHDLDDVLKLIFSDVYCIFCFHVRMHLNSLLIMQELEVEGELPEKVSCYQGVFYNYFSIGMYLIGKLFLSSSLISLSLFV